MQYNDLREFIAALEEKQLLKRVHQSISPNLEMTEISDRVLRQGGPALLFENPKGYSTPVLTNLFGTPKRVAMGMGEDNVEALREVGKLLAFLKEPEPPKGLKDAWQSIPKFKKVLDMAPPFDSLRKQPSTFLRMCWVLYLHLKRKTPRLTLVSFWCGKRESVTQHWLAVVVIHSFLARLMRVTSSLMPQTKKV